jgi:hypothetical protein
VLDPAKVSNATVNVLLYPLVKVTAGAAASIFESVPFCVPEISIVFLITHKEQLL